KSIYTTQKESALWTQFWVRQGLTSSEVAYDKGLSEESSLIKVEEILSHPKVCVVGLVVNKVDRIMHGMELGTAGMHNQVRQWAEQGFMEKLLDLLLNAGFKVFLASDHGNVEAKGCGRPSEGAVSELRGQRVRVYPDQILRARVKEHFPDAIEWLPLGLPEDYLPLLAPNRSAFVREEERIVGHGGISIEELIVPFIQIKRRST
ncbi:MAG: BREX-3 system phosphatase PglZ, partial [Candidatus Bipolaricaulia bacterium]